MLDLDRLHSTLYDHGVRYIVIGGSALNMLGVGLLTEDVDICYEATQENTRSLARALRALNAVPVDADLRPLPMGIEPRALQLHDSFLFITSAGRLDCLRVPDGTSGYDDLIRTAEAHTVRDVPVLVPAYEDMRRMKLATNRPKDRLGLEELGALLDILDDEPAPPVNPSNDVSVGGGAPDRSPPGPARALRSSLAGRDGGWIRVREHRRADRTLVHEHYRRRPSAG